MHLGAVIEPPRLACLFCVAIVPPGDARRVAGFVDEPDFAELEISGGGRLAVVKVEQANAGGGGAVVDPSGLPVILRRHLTVTISPRVADYLAARIHSNDAAELLLIGGARVVASDRLIGFEQSNPE